MKRTAQYEGVLKLGSLELEAAVLDDGTRVIKQGEVFKAFSRPARGNSRAEINEIKVPPFMDAKNLQPFIDEEVEGMIKPIPYLAQSGARQQGYDCQILPIVCQLYLKARKEGVLTKNQEEVAQKAEDLVQALAKVGIIALVDEATGYQYERERDELQKILKAYIAEELLPWQKTFPDEFYKQIFRLNGWDYTVKGIQKRPQVIGKWTNTLIYDRLPQGVLEELKTRTPKHARLHQNLTQEVGHPHLSKQIQRVIAILQIADTMDQLWALFEKLNDRERGQLGIPFQ